MSKSSVCQKCANEYEKRLRESGKRKYTKFKATTSNSHPCLGMFYKNEDDEEQYLSHAFEINYCCVCGDKI